MFEGYPHLWGAVAAEGGRVEDLGVDGGGTDLLLPGEAEEGGAIKMWRRIWGQMCLNLLGMRLIGQGCRLLLQAQLYLWLSSPGRCQAGRPLEWVAEGLLHAPEVQTSLQECCRPH